MVEIITTIKTNDDIFIEEKTFELPITVRVEFVENKYGKRINIINDNITSQEQLVLRPMYDQLAVIGTKVTDFTYKMYGMVIYKKDLYPDFNYSIAGEYPLREYISFTPV